MLGLLVGQQNDLWKQLQDWLEQLGWKTVLVASYALGRRELQQNSDIDLAIIDAGSTDECSLRFITLVRSDSRLTRIPIIVCGTSIDREVARKYGELGVENILLLPTIKDTFEAKISKAILNGKPPILIVDDEELIRDLLGEFLRFERYIPILASSADQASQIIRSQRVDAIVTDINMSGRTGLELLAEVKSEFSHIPVILITENASHYGPKEITTMGADGYFAKPFHNVELNHTLHKVLVNRARRETSLAPAGRS